MEKRIPEITYYALGCPACDDLFRELFIFCVQNAIPYEIKRHVKNLDEPKMRWGKIWLQGEDMVNEFKKAWRENNAV